MRGCGGRAELSPEAERSLSGSPGSELRTARPGLVRDVAGGSGVLGCRPPSGSPEVLGRDGVVWNHSGLSRASERPKRRREGKRLIAPSGARFLPSGRWEGREEGEEESVRR